MKAPAHVKCNCGHVAKDHFEKEGSCNQCGCTWYHPNDKWILKQKALKQKEKRWNKYQQ